MFFLCCCNFLFFICINTLISIKFFASKREKMRPNSMMGELYLNEAEHMQVVGFPQGIIHMLVCFDWAQAMVLKPAFRTCLFLFSDKFELNINLFFIKLRIYILNFALSNVIYEGKSKIIRNRSIAHSCFRFFKNFFCSCCLLYHVITIC